jgi:hypothetical protein
MPPRRAVLEAPCSDDATATRPRRAAAAAADSASAWRGASGRAIAIWGLFVKFVRAQEAQMGSSKVPCKGSVVKLFFFRFKHAEGAHRRENFRWKPVWQHMSGDMCIFVLVFCASHSLQECEASCAHLSDYLLSDCICMTVCIRLPTNVIFCIFTPATVLKACVCAYVCVSVVVWECECIRMCVRVWLCARAEERVRVLLLLMFFINT